MATVTDTRSAGGTVRQLTDATGTRFVAVAFALPVLAALVAAGWRDLVLLNLVHVASGAIWTGATVFVAGVLAPTVGTLEPKLRGQVNAPLIPKNVFLFSGVAIATLLTGPMLAVRMGVFDLSNTLVVLALFVGLGLLVGSVYLIWVQVLVFGEFRKAGGPDPQRVGALAGKLSKVSPAMLGLQLTVLVLMALIRAGPSI